MCFSHVTRLPLGEHPTRTRGEEDPVLLEVRRRLSEVYRMSSTLDRFLCFEYDLFGCGPRGRCGGFNSEPFEGSME